MTGCKLASIIKQPVILSRFGMNMTLFFGVMSAKAPAKTISHLYIRCVEKQLEHRRHPGWRFQLRMQENRNEKQRIAGPAFAIPCNFTGVRYHWLLPIMEWLYCR
jgi:hypothetical protein